MDTFFYLYCPFIFPNTFIFVFFRTVGLSHSQRIDCCTTMSNNNYQHHFSTSKLQLLNSLHSASSANADSSTTNRNNLVSTSSNLSRRPSFTLQSPLQHRPIVENIISDNNNSHTYRQQMPDPFNFNSRRGANAFSSLRRSDSYSPGTVWSYVVRH